jgi:vanillate O-demethylase ferredoxin subunit
VAGGEQAFEVELASSGRRVQVPPGRSIVQVLAEHGVDIPVSCEQGVCGTCLTRVLAGVPDHRDMYLTDDEHAANDQMTPCCSRATTACLVLDL